MRRNIVHDGAGELKYEIREIVEIAHKLRDLGRNIIWENIGDPIQKGEAFPEWIKEIVIKTAAEDSSYGYTATIGEPGTRECLAKIVNGRGGCKITKDDIIFFNGLGDAIATLFGYMKREARVLGPSPAYSTLSSAEGAHSGYHHSTYKLDPDNSWLPDVEDIRNKVMYNDSIAGILLINPDNPTGAVYPKKLLDEIVRIAKNHDLFILCDETYAHIVYNGTSTLHLSEVIGDVPGIALRSISKEFPWPGARCGWMEVMNRDKDENFNRYIRSLVDAKRLEVCSTTLPQKVIPRVYNDPRFLTHLKMRNKMFQERAQEAEEALVNIPGIKVIPPRGAFYLTVLFEEGILNSSQKLKIEEEDIKNYVESITYNVEVDKRFVYYLLGATGVCVVPLTGFCSDLKGFRMTLLETNDALRRKTFNLVANSIKEYLGG
ncbi:MAG: pyridoxal phosphate-dependent aminotransferase [Spirochaetia bacterium]